MRVMITTSAPGSRVGRLRMRQIGSGVVKVLILLEIDDTVQAFRSESSVCRGRLVFLVPRRA